MILIYVIGFVILGTIVESVVGQAVRNHIDGRPAAEFEQLRKALGNRDESRTKDGPDKFS